MVGYFKEYKQKMAQKVSGMEYEAFMLYIAGVLVRLICILCLPKEGIEAILDLEEE